MGWFEKANETLHRSTGYTLTRESPAQREQATREAARAAARRARRRTLRQERRKAQAAAAQRVPGQGKGFWNAYDPEVRSIVERVSPRTMTGAAKLVPLVEATRYVVRNQVPGAVVECGVWRGGSMQAVAWTLQSLGDTDRDLHLFDTFEGMPPPTVEDTRTTEQGAVSAEDMLARSEKDARIWAVATLDDVQAGMAETGYPDERVHFHPGLVEETTPGQAPERIALLRLDTDWYASTRHELEHLYHRLSPGGILILDDYGDWDGARKATDEWLAETGVPLFLVPMGSGRIAVKPAGSAP